MRDRYARTKRRLRAGLGTQGASMIEYIVLLGVVALAAIYGFKQARIRENRAIAMQARIVKTLDIDNPGQNDWNDPIFGDDWKKPVCNEKGVCTVPGQCFAAGTLVATEHGLAPIETIHEGDLVLSRDEKTGAIGLRPVVKTFVTPNQAVFDLRIASRDGGETIRPTTGHPFWVTGRGWVPAADLGVSQELWSPSGEPLHLALSAPTKLRYETVYNFEIAEYHTYFVGHHGMWVHNGGPSAAGPPIGPCQKGTPGTIGWAEKSGIPLGGSYSDIFNARRRDNGNHTGADIDNRIGGEIHHVPAKDIWAKWQPPPPPFDKNTGPAIWLETQDHYDTKSRGSGPDAEKYRADQDKLIKEGKLCDAVQMDIDDIRSIASKSGDASKYDKGLAEMMAYVRAKAAELGQSCDLH